MDWEITENKKLVRAIVSLRTPDEARDFLRDLMTEGEIAEFGKRLQAAEMLAENISYTTIGEKTGLSSATIARVSKWLKNGMGGYKSVIKKLHHHTGTVARED
jgi:TrpR-related protein YerC/YecD